MTRTRSLFLILGLAFAPACVLRAQGHLATSGGVAYEEPPAPRVESHESRGGYLWVNGRWNWNNNQWVWMDGHYERDRAGYAWTEGRWERRGNQWHWNEGQWVTGGVSTTTTVEVRDHRHQDSTPDPVDVRDHRNGVSDDNGMYPMQAPPPLRTETYGTPPGTGYIWVTGRWDWQNRNWVWMDGHWERQRARKTWVSGSWQMQGGHYIWVEGGWQ